MTPTKRPRPTRPPRPPRRRPRPSRPPPARRPRRRRPSSTTTTTVPEIIRQPLTGEPVASEADIVPRAAMVVKIDNVPQRGRTRPGLANADIVFEEIVEGRATRLAAVFHTQSADPIGPIRSGRTQDIALFSSFNSPLFVWSGGNGGVTRAIDDSTLINMGPNHAQGYFRGPGSAPHNYYNTTDRIWLQTPPTSPARRRSSSSTWSPARPSPVRRAPVSPSRSAARGSTGHGTPRSANSIARRTGACTSTRRTVRSARRM